MNNDRYIRQVALPNVGEDGQQKLSEAAVLVIGAGGLGNAVLPYLASSGVGTIGIMDADVVALSNLHRQVLFSENDMSKSKAFTSKNRLSTQFPEINIKVYDEYLSGTNALEILKNYDIIVDATDAIEVRYLINDACMLVEKPFVHAAVYRFQFQVATFNVNGSGTYRCLYPNPPKTVQSCDEAGVMPSTVAMAGLYQVNEVFKFLLNIGDLLTNKMLLVDTLKNTQNTFHFERKAHNTNNYEFFQNIYGNQTIAYKSFQEAKENDGLFLDVRQPKEAPQLALKDYVKIPIEQLSEHLNMLPMDKNIYLFCQSGKRSQKAYELLKKNQFKKLYCLTDNAPEIAHEEKENSIYTR